MKFFHISDLHIGLKLFNRDLSRDQEYVFRQIAALAEQEKPEAVVIAGDIYDKAVPSSEAVELFDRFVSGLTEAVPKAEIMMISGNHDSAPRINMFRSVLQHQHIHMIGLPPEHPEESIEKVTLEDAFGPVNFYLLPFVKPSMVREITASGKEEGGLSYDEALHRLIGREAIRKEERNVLVSHQFYLPAGMNPASVERMDSEIVSVGNIDAVRADLLQKFDYAALGHIHKPMCVGSEYYRYCGTPLACSVSERGQQKGVVLVNLMKKGEIQTKVLPLTPLHEIKILKGTLEEVLRQKTEDYVTIVLTDQVDQEAMDMQDRLHQAFPNLLEIRREGLRLADYTASCSEEKLKSPYELCSSFLGGLSDEEADVLRDAINSAQEGYL